MIRVFSIALVALLLPAAGAAQSVYVAGAAGVSAGDGGGAPAVVASVGYLTPRRIGFEIEFGLTPSLDLLGGSFTPLPWLLDLPSFEFDVTGRLLTLQTNVVAPLPTAGKLRIHVIGGGGVANLNQDLRFHFGPMAPASTVITRRDPFPTLPGRPFSDSALVLNIGGIIEYAATDRLAVGIDARYHHLFFTQALDLARVTGRLSWTF